MHPQTLWTGLQRGYGGINTIYTLQGSTLQGMQFLTLSLVLHYAGYMRMLALLIGALVVYNSVGIFILTLGSTPTYSIARTQLDDTEKIGLADYFADKGKRNAEIASTFDALLAASPVQVLGKSTSTIQQYNNKTVKQSYTIAILGDSMVDTLGRDLPHLSSFLKSRLPGIKFTLINHGVGAANIESGLSRLTNGYTYLGENRPAVLSQNPDIVVIESFAYNHWDNTQSDLDRQWTTLARMTDTIKSNNPETKIVLAVTVAPYCPTYTDGSANLPPERKYSECATVKAYLQNAVSFAGSSGYAVADAYHVSILNGEGNPKYINQTDHIHPSESGKMLFSRKVAEAIVNGLN